MGLTNDGRDARCAPFREGIPAGCASFDFFLEADRDADFFGEADFSRLARPPVALAGAFFAAVLAAFRSAFLIDSASHAFFFGTAARLLCHSADFWSPAISSSDRLVSAE